MAVLGLDVPDRLIYESTFGFVFSVHTPTLKCTLFLELNSDNVSGEKKTGHLRSLENASENLKLFTADLLDYDATAAAIAGCQGVFHVASPVPSSKLTYPELEVVRPAVTGTRNVLEAASSAKIRRVVVLSSMVAIDINPKGWPKDKIKDENCWSDTEFCRNNEVSSTAKSLSTKKFSTATY